jgi:hypothetical protein
MSQAILAKALAYWNARFHPFTCGNDSAHRNLTPSVTDDGLVCLDCDYSQGAVAVDLLLRAYADRADE